MIRLIALFIILPLTVFAQSADTYSDTWISTNDDIVWSASGYSMAEIIAMADLDGDPSVISPDEQAMIELLAQVLGVTPHKQ